MRQPSIALAIAVLTLAGCTTGHPAPTAARRSDAPVAQASAPVLTQVAALTGKVKLLVDAGVIANNGASIISNNSGALVSDNGAGIIGNHGGSYRLTAAAPVEVGLADALVEVYDAAGKAVLGADGKPVTATTDQQGAYQLNATLPAQNLVLRVKLGSAGSLHGGQLSALLPKGGVAAAEQGIDTASTLGASYVLAKFVQGSQATYDKLPGAEVTQLHQDLVTATAGLASAPAYDETSLNALVDDLRGKTAAVGKTLDDIQALLLGQANGGDGRPGTQVAIADPHGLVIDAKGRVLIGEHLFGRIRALNPDGTLTTYADALRGEVKSNFTGFHGLASGPDGSVYVASGYQVYHVTADGKSTSIGGGTISTAGAVDVRATLSTFYPASIAVGSDGTVYIGEGRDALAEATPPRLLSITPDGMLHQVPLGTDLPLHGRVQAMAIAPDGRIVFEATTHEQVGTLYAYKPGGALQTLHQGMAPDETVGGIAIAPNGRIYVSDTGRVLAFDPDGSQTIIAGKDGPAATQALGRSDSLLLKPDGTLLVVDKRAQVVWALGKDGSFKVVAGVATAVQGSNADLAISAPHGAAFDDQGRLLVAQASSHELELVNGSSVSSLLGLGTSAASGPVDACTGVAYHAGKFYVLDNGHHRLLRVGTDGTGEVLAGNPLAINNRLEPGQRADAMQFNVNGESIAVAADGMPYWSDLNSRQIFRLAADGMVELVAGKAPVYQPGQATTPTAAEILATSFGDEGPAPAATLLQPEGLAFDAHGDLYFVDAAQLTLRKITGLDGPAPTIHLAYGLNAAQQLAANAPIDAVETDAKTANLHMPAALAFSSTGSLYVAELGTATLPLLASSGGTDLTALQQVLPTFYARIRRIDPDGKITPVVGAGSSLLTDPTAQDALELPLGLAFSADGRLAITDTASNLVRVLPAGSF